MLERIFQTIKDNNMISRGDRVTAALSGGADSVCLLLALYELQEKLGIHLSAIHVNHCLRGAESDRDEKFCEDLCSKLEIELIHRRFDVSGYAEAHHMSTELAARNIRYDFFREQTKGGKIATAHNANDNAETVIFNLARGTGIKGIAGIPPVRDNIIRPLIHVSRDEIEQFLHERNQPYVTDSTNLTDEYTRNRIRHNVIPVLKNINPSLLATISSDSDNFRLDSSYLEQQSYEAYNKCLTGSGSLKGLASFHKAIRHRCITSYLKNNNIEVNHKRISEIDDIVLYGGKINLKRNIYIISSDDDLIIKSIVSEEKNTEYSAELKAGRNSFMNRIIDISYSDIFPESADAVLDADAVTGTLTARNRRPGDRIRISGKGFSSSVKKLFNRNIPPEERNSICFICDQTGPLYIERTGISETAAVSEKTQKYICINII